LVCRDLFKAVFQEFQRTLQAVNTEVYDMLLRQEMYIGKIAAAQRRARDEKGRKDNKEEKLRKLLAEEDIYQVADANYVPIPLDPAIEVRSSSYVPIPLDPAIEVRSSSYVPIPLDPAIEVRSSSYVPIPLDPAIEVRSSSYVPIPLDPAVEVGPWLVSKSGAGALVAVECI
jgi:hypothetical protein